MDGARVVQTEDKAWPKVTLIVAAVAFFVLAVTFQVWDTAGHTVTTISKGSTSTSGGVPPAALVTLTLSFSAVLFLAGAFYSRMTKLLLPGGIELDFSTQAEITKQAAATAPNDPSKTAAIAHEATKLASDAAQRGAARTNPDGYAEFPHTDVMSYVAKAKAMVESGAT